MLAGIMSHDRAQRLTSLIAAAAPMSCLSTERVTFQNGNGETLVGILTLPDTPDVAVLCHGYTSSKDGFHLAAIAERLAAGGAASLR